jgi:septation ring formation regulator EzrA
MSDAPESLILRYLRGFDTKLDRVADDVRELKGRAGALEERYASVSRRLDSIELRLERIERRFDLIDEHTP